MSAEAKKALGQHFLVDENILRVVGRFATLDAADVVLEIGPGLGVLTRYLADRTRYVHAVEIDRDLEQPLRRSLGPRENVELHIADALSFEYANLEPAPTKLIANLPYNIATPLVLESLERLPMVTLWCVMVQREVADRLFADEGARAYGAVSVYLRLTTERIGFHPVSANVFRPRPNVASALVAFRRKEPPPDFARVKRIVGAAFAHRRKTLPNSLELAGVASRAAAAAALVAIGRPPDARAQQLAPEEFVRISALL